ncbi:hypothetical protein EDD17DRAFT_1532574, partial [Pisolithus thermaeus]
SIYRDGVLPQHQFGFYTRRLDQFISKCFDNLINAPRTATSVVCAGMSLQANLWVLGGSASKYGMYILTRRLFRRCKKRRTTSVLSPHLGVLPSTRLWYSKKVATQMGEGRHHPTYTPRALSLLVRHRSARTTDRLRRLPLRSFMPHRHQ